MGRVTPGAVRTVTLHALLSPVARARVVGQIEWTLKKPRVHQGIIAVDTDVSECEEGRLRIEFQERAPSEFGLQYLVNRVPVRRLDVNGSHRSWQFTTHKHRYNTAGHEDAYLPTDIPPVPLEPTVAPGTYRRVFEAFAGECFVSLPDGYWVEPEGRAS